MKTIFLISFLLPISLYSQSVSFLLTSKTLSGTSNPEAVTETDAVKYSATAMRIQTTASDYILSFTTNVPGESICLLKFYDVDRRKLQAAQLCFGAKLILPQGTKNHSITISKERCDNHVNSRGLSASDISSVKYIELEVGKGKNLNTGVTFKFAAEGTGAVPYTSTSVAIADPVIKFTLKPYSGAAEQLLNATSEPQFFPQNNIIQLTPKQATQFKNVAKMAQYSPYLFSNETITKNTINPIGGTGGEIWLSNSTDNPADHRFAKKAVTIKGISSSPIATGLAKKENDYPVFCAVSKSGSTVKLQTCSFNGTDFNAPIDIYTFPTALARADIKFFDWNYDGIEDIVVVAPEGANNKSMYVFESSRSAGKHSFNAGPVVMGFVPENKFYTIGRFANSGDKFQILQYTSSPPVMGQAGPGNSSLSLRSFGTGNRLSVGTIFKQSTTLDPRVLKELKVTRIATANLDGDDYSDLLIMDNTTGSPASGRIVGCYSDMPRGDNGRRLSYKFSIWHDAFGLSTDEVVLPVRFKKGGRGTDDLIAYKMSSGQGCIAYSDRNAKRFNGTGMCPLQGQARSAIFTADFNRDGTEDIMLIKFTPPPVSVQPANGQGATGQSGSNNAIKNASQTAAFNNNSNVQNTAYKTQTNATKGSIGNTSASSSDNKPQGPQPEIFNGFEGNLKLANELRESEFYGVLPMFGVKIYKDINEASNVYYYKPLYYKLAYNKAFGVNLKYGSSDEEALPDIEFTITDGVSKKEKASIKKYLRTLNLTVAEVLAYPQDGAVNPRFASNINVNADVQSFEDPRYRNESVIRLYAKATSDMAIEKTIGALAEDQGITGSLWDNQPLLLSFSDVNTLGAWEIEPRNLGQNAKLKNPFPFPIVVKNMHIMAFPESNGKSEAIIYSYRINETNAVNAGAEAQFDFTRFPAWLSSSNRMDRFWIEYELTGKDDTTVTELAEKIADNYYDPTVAKSEEHTITVTVDSAFQLLQIRSIYVSFYSKFFSKAKLQNEVSYGLEMNADGEFILKNKLYRNPSLSEDEFWKQVPYQVSVVTRDGEQLKMPGKIGGAGDGSFSRQLFLTNAKLQQWFPSLTLK